MHGSTLYCGDNCNHTGPHRYPPSGGFIVPDSVYRQAENVMFGTSVYALKMQEWAEAHPPKPLTRWERLRVWRWEIEKRLLLAYDALRGRHDCGDDY